MRWQFVKEGDERFVTVNDIARHVGRKPTTMKSFADRLNLSITSRMARARDGRKRKMACVAETDVPKLLTAGVEAKRYRAHRRRSNGEMTADEACRNAAVALKKAGVTTFTFENGKVMAEVCRTFKV